MNSGKNKNHAVMRFLADRTPERSAITATAELRILIIVGEKTRRH